MIMLDQSEDPDACDWMWQCTGRRYAARIETLAIDLSGVSGERRCPECGAHSACTMHGIARMERCTGTARENALILTGNLDAPL